MSNSKIGKPARIGRALLEELKQIQKEYLNKYGENISLTRASDIYYLERKKIKGDSFF